MCGLGSEKFFPSEGIHNFFEGASSSTCGAPEGVFTTTIPRGVTPSEKPVPRAFATASFAAKRAASDSAGFASDMQYDASTSPNAFLKCAGVFSRRARIRTTSVRSVPMPTISPENARHFPYFKMSSFISRTACPMPTTSARQIMLWPMFNSLKSAASSRGPMFE